jgi:hypothetical protein
LAHRNNFIGPQAIRTTTSPAITIHSVFDAHGRRIAEYRACPTKVESGFGERQAEKKE